VFVRHAIDTMTLQRVLIVAGVIALSGVAGAANGAGTMNPLASIAFAKDPQARLEFFSRDHPSWDDRLNVYPVMQGARGGGE
jgi:hypothetical protein